MGISYQMLGRKPEKKRPLGTLTLTVANFKNNGK
jgi:hypothetical protein